MKSQHKISVDRNRCATRTRKYDREVDCRNESFKIIERFFHKKLSNRAKRHDWILVVFNKMKQVNLSIIQFLIIKECEFVLLLYPFIKNVARQFTTISHQETLRSPRLYDNIVIRTRHLFEVVVTIFRIDFTTSAMVNSQFFTCYIVGSKAEQ